ncbi:tail assembly protein [Tateyamaria sp. syn59]|uniref:tail assembly protein n=1 Tax=Tateyamaria sp. syn59 TaxID=2576942 RepID=UPI0011BE2128|nr:tail assembly protein [Tateyamaria sp. syn59]
MIRTVYLHGALGEAFGLEFRLAIDSPAEAVRALCTMVDGFEAHMRDRYYQVFRGAEIDGRDQTPQELHVVFADDETELHIVPRAIGAKRRGLGKIILGSVLIAASFLIPGSTQFLTAVSDFAARTGVALALGGVSQMLAPTPSRANYEEREQPKSQLFGSAVNVTAPGVAVPVLVGECEVGSVVVSAAIHVEDRIG